MLTASYTGRSSSSAGFLQSGSYLKESVAVDPRLERVTAAIMSGTSAYSAVDVFDALTRLNELKRQAELEMDKIDILFVPTAPCHYSIAGGCSYLPSGYRRYWFPAACKGQIIRPFCSVEPLHWGSTSRRANL